MEELFLGVGIGFHAAVVIEVVAGEIGEHRDVDAGAVHPALLDADRAGFQRAGGGVFGAELGQVAHQGRRFRRREAGFDQRIREAGAERTDDRARLRVGAGQALADRRLAIGAGDGDQRQVFARVTIDHVGQRAGQRAQGVNGQCYGRPEILSKIKITAGLPEHGYGATRQRVGDVTAAIGQIARIGQEEIARPDLATVVGNTGRHDAHRLQAVKEFARRAHSLPFPEPASATWIGASGGTPRVRSAPPTIAEKAGPATSPP